jgi:predicted protein tyrosine phosphatase
MASPLRILFVCGRNQWRSPTAKRIYRKDPRVTVRLGGVASKSSRTISERDLDWADLVIVMEPRHAARIRANFRARDSFPPMESLDIPDEYQFMDKELIEPIRFGTEHCIKSFSEGR